MTDRPKRTSRWLLILLLIPAVVVTVASLFGLISAVAEVAAESRPGDLLFPLRQNALEMQLGLTTDPAERARIELRLTEAPALAATSASSAGGPASGSASATPAAVDPNSPAPTREPIRTEALTDAQETSATQEPTRTLVVKRSLRRVWSSLLMDT